MATRIKRKGRGILSTVGTASSSAVEVLETIETASVIAHSYLKEALIEAKKDLAKTQMEATKELIELGYTPEQAFEIVSLD
jgi:hypothetical protein